MLTNDDFQKIEKYIEFLKFVMVKINNYFENQREYICCKAGCSLCCTNGEYPCSELEFDLLKHGINRLSEDEKSYISVNVSKILNEKKHLNESEVFTYVCPFLKDDKCLVYYYRMLICRTFGLPYYVEESKNDVLAERLKMPFCVEAGLNYNEVFDKNTGMLSSELFRSKGFKNEPLAYNLSLKYLTKTLARDYNIDFGPTKPLIEWLEDLFN